MVRTVFGLDSLLVLGCLHSNKSLTWNLCLVTENGHNQVCNTQHLLP